MIPRVLEPEVMDTAREAADYDAMGWLGRKGMFPGKRRFEAWGRVRFFSPGHSPSFRSPSLIPRGICAPATQTLTL